MYSRCFLMYPKNRSSLHRGKAAHNPRVMPELSRHTKAKRNVITK